MDEIRSFKRLHCPENALDLDVSNWMTINELRKYLMKDTYTTKSLFTRIKEASAAGDYDKVSQLQLEMDEKMKVLRRYIQPTKEFAGHIRVKYMIMLEIQSVD